MFHEDRLRAARLAAGLTQAQAAQIAGVSPRTYQRYEAGTHAPNADCVRRLAAAVGASPEQISDGVLPDGHQVENAALDELAATILRKFGPQHQACILIEEMSELTKVLCKIQRGKFERGKLVAEFTHVRASCEVIRRIMAIDETDVSAEVRAKLNEYLTA